MSFEVAAEGYDRYVGRYSRALAPKFLDFAAITSGPVLDVGCGPGAVTGELSARFGTDAVAAVDPSIPFVAACRARFPGADVRVATGEALPFEDNAFGGAVSQLVLAFVREPNRMSAELRRVVRVEGVVATCMFSATGFEMLRAFWQAARSFDPDAPDDASLPFRRIAELVDLWTRAGFRDVSTATLQVSADYADFDDLWSPFAFGIGPAAGYLGRQSEERREAIRDAVFERLGKPDGPFSLTAAVVAVRGIV